MEIEEKLKDIARPLFYEIMQPRINSLCASTRSNMRSYKKKYKGQRCFIIGNGPSLTTNDLERLNHEITFAMNRIYVMFDKLKWRPTFYIVQDPTCIRSSINEINSIDQGIVKFVKPTGQKKYDIQNAIYFDVDYSLSWKDMNPGFSDNPEREIYDGKTVAYTALQFAVYMGFSKIYLLGLDCNYSPDNTEINERSYADKRMFKENGTGMLPDIDYWEKAFMKAKEYASIRDIEIYNATRGGNLEVFQRINFDELMGDRKKS